MCKVLGASRSGYYRFRQHIVRDREIANVRLLHEIRIVHEESHGIYGSPRIFVELQARGISCGRHRVERLMQGAGIVAKICRRYRVTTRARKGAQYCPDRLQRRFDVERVHQVWTSDITYIWTGEGWLYLAVVLDLKTRVVVGWATGERCPARLPRGWRRGHALQAEWRNHLPLGPREPVHKSGSREVHRRAAREVPAKSWTQLL